MKPCPVPWSSHALEDISHEDMSCILASILTLKKCELDLLEVFYLMQHILAFMCSYLSKLIPVIIKVDVTVLSLRKIERSH
jgi:hypothetical protein